MGWPTTPWTGKTAAELRPIIVALCNAVGERYECIGLTRPSWTVNTAQSISTVTIGTKSTNLIEDDLYGLDIFRYGWWTLIANHISTLVNLSSGSDSTPGTTHCRGWSKDYAGTGLTTNIWTISDLETDVGMGTLSQSSVGGSMHLFDEVAPNRLREFLDRLICPVIFPVDKSRFSYSGGSVVTGLSSAAVADINDTIQGATDSGDGDDAWNALVDTNLGILWNGVNAGYSVSWDGGSSFSRAIHSPISYAALDFESVQNGVGYLGDLVRQIYVIGVSETDASSFDFTISGATATGSDGAEIEGIDAIAITGVVEMPFTTGNYGRSPSPGASAPAAGPSPPSGYEGYGQVFAVPNFLFAQSDRDGGTRANSTRFILDLTSALTDQA